MARPKAEITPEIVLRAYASFHSVGAAARSLGISHGLAWGRLKEVGVCPLGMSRSEAGKLGQKCKRIEVGVRP